jgi:hypothetical protein
MEEIEKLMKSVVEGLSSLSPSMPPEEAAQKREALISGAVNALKNLVFTVENNARNSARAQHYGEIKKKLASLAPDVFQSVSDDMKWEDMVTKLVGQRKESIKKEPQETPEQLRARLQLEFEQKLKKEKENLLITAALNEIEASAIVNKLDDNYKGIFRAAIQSELVPEIQNERVVFKTKEGEYLSENGTFATPKAVAAFFLKKYPRLIAESKQSPQPPRGDIDASSASLTHDKNGRPLDRLKAGIAELRLAK